MNSTVQQPASIGAAQSVKLTAVFALLAGFGLVYMTGFSHSSTLHNAAHDTRHAMSFPCH